MILCNVMRRTALNRGYFKGAVADPPVWVRHGCRTGRNGVAVRAQMFQDRVTMGAVEPAPSSRHRASVFGRRARAWEGR